MTGIKSALVAILTCLALVFGGASAYAAPVDRAVVTGCHSPVVNKAKPWGVDYTYLYQSISRIPRIATIRMVATTVYAWCPNGRTRPDKVMPLSVDLCHLHHANASWLFDGVKFDVTYADDIKALVVPREKVPDGDGGEQVCVHVNITEQKWFLTSLSASVAVDSWIVFRLISDEPVAWKTEGGDDENYFHPLLDVNVSEWYEWPGRND